ncbi:rhomboid-like protein [Mycobacterium paraintracellulare]|nr:rhomboid-like protein [Mycobacterium paraintracellulare]
MAPASVRARVRSMTLAVWHFVSTAPLTYGWLLVLMVTTIIQNHLTGRQLHSVLLHRSTNIHELGKDPLHVLFSSLLWIDGKSFEPHLLLFTLFLAPAEHWLGQLRWLSVGLSSHILATYISEGILYFAIEERDASQRLVHARDIGVSYFLVGVMAVLTYHIARPWRWGYLGVLFVIFGFPLITMDRVDLDFTAIGHFASILIGLCFYPMTRTRSRRSRQVSPARLKAMARRSVPPS